MTDVLTLAPDMEALVSSFLREQDEVQALVGDRVYTVLPTKPEGLLPSLDSFVLLTLVPSGADPRPHTDWLHESRIQVDVWAKQKKAARTLAAVCRAACVARIRGSHDEGVVTSVRAEGMGYQPDSDLADPPRPRYLFDLVLVNHPPPDVPGTTSSS